MKTEYSHPALELQKPIAYSHEQTVKQRMENMKNTSYKYAESGKHTAPQFNKQSSIHTHTHTGTFPYGREEERDGLLGMLRTLRKRGRFKNNFSGTTTQLHQDIFRPLLY